MRSIKVKAWAGHIAALATAMFLTACGGGGGEPTFIPQFNVSERQLYEPSRMEAGIVARRGSGAVSLQLETPGSTMGLPWGEDTGSSLGRGVDRFYFDLVDSGYIHLSMSDEMLQVIGSLELYDANQSLLWRLDSSRRNLDYFWLYRTDYTQAPPRYEIRITSVEPGDAGSHVLVWFGDRLAPTANPNDLYKYSQLGSCANCDVSSAQLGGYSFDHPISLSRVNMRSAWLARVLDASALSLEPSNLFKIFWSSAQVAGAIMNNASLNEVDFTGAVITGAGRSPAQFNGAAMNHVVFEGLNLDRIEVNESSMIRRASLTDVNFRGASMIEAQFTNASISQSYFTSSNLLRASFHGASLTQVDFSGAHLEQADLRATLSNVNFRNANLKGANLPDTGMSNVDFSGAIWTDGITRCAEGSINSCK